MDTAEPDRVDLVTLIARTAELVALGAVVIGCPDGTPGTRLLLPLAFS